MNLDIQIIEKYSLCYTQETPFYHPFSELLQLGFKYTKKDGYSKESNIFSQENNIPQRYLKWKLPDWYELKYQPLLPNIFLECCIPNICHCSHYIKLIIERFKQLQPFSAAIEQVVYTKGVLKKLIRVLKAEEGKLVAASGLLELTGRSYNNFGSEGFIDHTIMNIGTNPRILKWVDILHCFLPVTMKLLRKAAFIIQETLLKEIVPLNYRFGLEVENPNYTLVQIIVNMSVQYFYQWSDALLLQGFNARSLH